MESKIVGSDEARNDDIVFMNGQGEEVLRVSHEGFFVQGRPVEVADPAEHDKVVYQTLKHLMLGITTSPVQIDYGNLGDLIEALQIIGRHGKHGETHCEHDVFTVHGIDPALVSESDKARLKELGFFINDEFHNGVQHFTSYRWGSC